MKVTIGRAARAFITLGALLVVVPGTAEAQMEQPTPEQMQAMMAAMQPGPEHERFARLVGEWDLETSVSMAPGQTQVLKARTVARTILGGRFLVTEMTSADSVLGMPIEGMTIFGYDRRTGEYTILALDTFGTYYVAGAGTGDVNTNPIVMRGSHHDPFMDRQEVYDFVLRFVDADTWESEIVFITPDGERFTAVKAIARRRP
jgi:hypothetical protein